MTPFHIKYEFFSSKLKFYYQFWFWFCYSESEIQIDGKFFTLKPDMVTVKRFQKTVHGKELFETSNNFSAKTQKPTELVHSHTVPELLRPHVVISLLISVWHILQLIGSCGRPGRGSKTHNQARCACAHLEYNAIVWGTAGWHTSCRQ